MAHWGWDTFAKAADVAQLTGLDVIVLVTFVVKYVRITRNSSECHKLEERVRRLRTLMLQWPSSSELEAGSPMRALLEALDDAASLVDSYTTSTLWRRVLRGRRLASQFRDMQCNIDSCIAVVFFNLHVHPDPPRSSDVRIGPIGVDHGGADSTPTEPRNGADDQARTSPDSHVINIDHEGTDKELGATVTANLASCEIMSDD